MAIGKIFIAVATRLTIFADRRDQRVKSLDLLLALEKVTCILNLRRCITLMYCITGIFTGAFDKQIEWLIVKGISDYADGAEGTAENWSNFASIMAASVAAHILSDPCVFRSWPHYGGNDVLYMCENRTGIMQATINPVFSITVKQMSSPQFSRSLLHQSGPLTKSLVVKYGMTCMFVFL